MGSEIKRGEIYWVDWNPSRGSEQAGIRPALIIQNDIGNKYSPNTIVASCTKTSHKSLPFLVPIKAKESGLPNDSTVDLASLITISKDRLRGKCGELSQDKMAEIDKAILNSLALNHYYP
jgi:mRNA interferase MazF